MPVVPSQIVPPAGPRPDWIRPLTPVYALPFQLPTDPVCVTISLLSPMSNVEPAEIESVPTLLVPPSAPPVGVSATDPVVIVNPPVRTVLTVSVPLPDLISTPVPLIGPGSDELNPLVSIPPLPAASSTPRLASTVI